nr:MAG TPA: hypothetical protein [Caudoviricetes sp.]
MKIYKEQSLENVQFWSGAEDRVKYLTADDFQIIENELEQLYPEGIGETELNDLFWFEEDWIAELLGYTDFEQLVAERSNE